MTDAGSTKKVQDAHADHQVWIANIVLLAVVASGYLQHAPTPLSVTMAAHLYLGLVTCAATISLVPGLLVMLARRLGTPDRLRFLLSATLWTLTVLLLFIDLQLYGIFRYHFNDMIWNVLTTPGADEAVLVSSTDLWIIGVGTIVLFALEMLLNHLHRRPAESRRWFVKPGPLWKLVLLPIMLLQVSLLARAELVHDREVMSVSRLYPVLPKVSVQQLYLYLFGDTPLPAPLVEPEDILLDYPARDITLPTNGPTPNVVLIVVDSLRADMLAPATMPRTSAFADRATVFLEHYSGGNATRFGVFSLVYGLHGCYWRWIHRERHSPVLIDALLERGYQTKILTSASMSFPELRSTAWVRIEASVEDRLRGVRPGGRDDGVRERFVKWLVERKPDDAPFFAFLLLDAPHQNFHFPQEFAHFKPYAQDLSYLKLASGPTQADLTALRNRYRNAVLYADHIVGALLEAMAASGELERSIVVITGDHGEEFMEHGFFGHASNFTRSQLHVPLIWFDRSSPPGEISMPTSHADVPVTVLERLGLDPALRRHWSLGNNLFDGQSDRARVVSGWDTLGVLLPSHHVVELPMKAYGRGAITVYDPSWQPATDGEEILRSSSALVGRMARECRRFLR